MSIKVIAFKVDKKPECIEIENTLEALQAFVSGYIETVTRDDLVFIVNEEGALNGMRLNMLASMYCGIPLCGDVLLCGVDEGEFADVPERMLTICKA